MKIRNGIDLDARRYCEEEGIEVEDLPHDGVLWSVWISYPDGTDLIYRQDLDISQVNDVWNDACIHAWGTWHAAKEEVRFLSMVPDLPVMESVPEVPEVPEPPLVPQVPELPDDIKIA